MKKRPRQKLWMGIDPGLSGGIAITNSQKEWLAQPMPTSDQEVLFAIEEMASYGKLCHVYLEQVGARPGQGVVSMFRFGESYGFLQGILIAKKLPFTLIRPQDWQREMFRGTLAMKHRTKRDPKERALEVINRTHPGFLRWFFEMFPRRKKPHDGMIDSLLIAEVARRKNA